METRVAGVRDNKLASGMWKFTDAISELELISFAKKLLRDDKNYLELYIRQSGKNHAICFQYHHSGERKEYETFLKRTTEVFRKRFGKIFAGYDVASSTVPIK